MINVSMLFSFLDIRTKTTAVEMLEKMGLSTIDPAVVATVILRFILQALRLCTRGRQEINTCVNKIIGLIPGIQRGHLVRQNSGEKAKRNYSRKTIQIFFQKLLFKVLDQLLLAYGRCQWSEDTKNAHEKCQDQPASF